MKKLRFRIRFSPGSDLGSRIGSGFMIRLKFKIKLSIHVFEDWIWV